MSLSKCWKKDRKSQHSSTGSPPMAVVRTCFVFSRTACSEETAFLFLRSLLGHFNLALLRLLQHAYIYVLVNVVRNLLCNCRFRRRLAWSALHCRRRLQLLFQVRYLVLQFSDCSIVCTIFFFKNLDKEFFIDSEFFRMRFFL